MREGLRYLTVSSSVATIHNAHMFVDVFLTLFVFVFDAIGGYYLSHMAQLQ